MQLLISVNHELGVIARRPKADVAISGATGRSDRVVSAVKRRLLTCTGMQVQVSSLENAPRNTPWHCPPICRNIC